MRHPSSIRPLLQASSIIAAVLILVTGVTYAALQSQQATLSGNQIATATADLQVSKDNTTYARTLPGYMFSGLIPGGSAQPTNGNPVYVKNVGNAALMLKISLNPAITNQQNVDLSKVHVILSPFGGGVPQNLTVQDLVTADTSGGTAITLSGASRLAPGTNFGFTMQVSMESDAVSSSTATISDMVFNINATAVN